MKIIRGLHHFKKDHQGCVATIGNFDGVHLGHQTVIHRLEDRAMEHQLPSILMIFEPQPEEFFARDNQVPARLTRLREKIELLRTYKIDQLMIVPFHANIAALTADQFIQYILSEKLNVKHLVVGDDFHFGKNRVGNFDYLKKATGQFHFTTEHIPTCFFDRDKPFLKPKRISSSWIRNLLQAGNLTKAKQLLGHDYSMCGRITLGDRRGRTLGIPTINMHLHRKRSPLLGVYAVTVSGLDENIYQGVANIGIRPTIQSSGNQLVLESHLFDFNQDVYNRYVKITFLHKIRDERKFKSLDLLKAQIEKDVKNAKKYFEKT